MRTGNDASAAPSTDSRWVRIAGWFLAISYGIGAPMAAVAEFRGHLLSSRFDLPPALIYVVSAVQLACAGLVLVRRYAPWAAAALSVTSLGALASHIRIGSPATGVTALAFTMVQVWFGLASRGGRAPRKSQDI